MKQNNNNIEKIENEEEQNLNEKYFLNKNENININNEKKLSDLTIKKIIQIKDKEEQKILQLNNNEKTSTNEIKINFNKSNENSPCLNKNNQIYKKSFPKLNEYFNHDYNNYDSPIYQKFPKQYEQLFIKYNNKMNDLNFINNSYNIPNPNFPNIITNNNNYYYSILDDSPIHMPLYINNTSKLNDKPNDKLYNINVTSNNLTNNINNYSLFKNNYYNENELYNHINNYNSLQIPQIRQNNYFNPNYLNEYNAFFHGNNYFREFSSDYSFNRSKFINNRYLSQNGFIFRKNIYNIPFLQKRAHSHEKPLNLIHKYYDGNFIMEEENEEENYIDKEKKLLFRKDEEYNYKKDINRTNIDFQNNRGIKTNFESLQEEFQNDKHCFDNEKNKYKSFNNLKLLEQNKLINNYYHSSSNIRINKDDNPILNNYNKNNVLINNNHSHIINPNNLVYERKSIHKKFRLNNTPDIKEVNKIKKEIIKSKKNNDDIIKHDTSNNNINKIKNKDESKLFKEKEMIKKKIKNQDERMKINKIRKVIDVKKEVFKKLENKKQEQKKNYNNKKVKNNLDKYNSNSNTIILLDRTINKSKNTIINDKRNEKILNSKGKKVKLKSLINNTNSKLKSDLHRDFTKNNINTNNESDSKTYTEKRKNIKNKIIFFDPIRIINIGTKKNKAHLKFNLKSLEHSYDNISSKRMLNVSGFNNIFQIYNISQPANISKNKLNLSGENKISNIIGDKKINKNIQTINYRTNRKDIKFISKRNLDDKAIKNKNKIIQDKALKHLTNSSDNISKIKNINKIQLNIVKRKFNLDKNNIPEDSYTRQYIKKAKSKEKSMTSKSKTEKSSLKSSITHTTQKIDLNKINNMKKSCQKIEIKFKNSKKCRISQIKEINSFKTLNEKSPFKRNIKNKIVSKNRKVFNTSIQMNSNTKTIRNSLIKAKNNISENLSLKMSQCLTIKKNNTDFINTSNNFNTNQLYTNKK